MAARGRARRQAAGRVERDAADARGAHVREVHGVRDGEAGELHEARRRVEARHAAARREARPQLRLALAGAGGRARGRELVPFLREPAPHHLDAHLELLLHDVVAAHLGDAWPRVRLGHGDHAEEVLHRRVLQHLHEARDEALLAAPGPDGHVVVAALVLLRQELRQPLPQRPLRRRRLAAEELHDVLVPGADLILQEAHGADDDVQRRVLPHALVQPERGEQRRVRVHLRHDEVIHVEELRELRHGQVRLHGAVGVGLAVAALRADDAVALLDVERRRLEDAGHAAARDGGGPDEHVRRREVVEQPRRVRAVLGGHGDVDDAPRAVEGLLEGVEPDVRAQHRAEVLRVHL
mmetsp:Transcript_38702/g.121294  ORF Transcript_38702/g.121294 Transcript_38702/m.121294 type:complete len:351 (+) Transcript_38702:475-1527(+)